MLLTKSKKTGKSFINYVFFANHVKRFLHPKLKKFFPTTVLVIRDLGCLKALLRKFCCFNSCFPSIPSYSIYYFLRLIQEEIW